MSALAVLVRAGALLLVRGVFVTASSVLKNTVLEQ